MTIYAFEGHVPDIHETAYVAPSAQVLGRVVLGARCYVGHGAILRGDYGLIEVGPESAIEEGAIVHARPGDATRIGARVTVGHGAMIHNATIHEGATLGMRSVVSDFAVVGAGAIVGEMTLVKQRQEIPPHKVAVGVPARVVGEVSEKHHDMAVWAKDVYVDLTRRYPSGLLEIPAAGAPCAEILFRPIGKIRTPFREPEQAPIQGAFVPEAEGTVELDPALAEGLADLDGFSHVILLYAFHRTRGYALRVRPYLDDAERGLFATRAPRRPNPIGLTVVRLVAVEGSTLRVAGVDMLDETPLLDVKPYVPGMEPGSDVRTGWLAVRLAAGDVPRHADRRFHRDAAQ